MGVNCVVNLATVNRHVFLSLDAETHFIAPDLNHSHRDVIADDNTLVFLPGEYQHRCSSLNAAGSNLSGFYFFLRVRKNLFPKVSES